MAMTRCGRPGDAPRASALLACSGARRGPGPAPRHFMPRCVRGTANGRVVMSWRCPTCGHRRVIRVGPPAIARRLFVLAPQIGSRRGADECVPRTRGARSGVQGGTAPPLLRHGRAPCRPSTSSFAAGGPKTWMPATSAGMTRDVSCRVLDVPRPSGGLTEGITRYGDNPAAGVPADDAPRTHPTCLQRRPSRPRICTASIHAAVRPGYVDPTGRSRTSWSI